MSLEGRSAIVTGSTSGIGLAIAEALAPLGFTAYSDTAPNMQGTQVSDGGWTAQ